MPGYHIRNIIFINISGPGNKMLFEIVSLFQVVLTSAREQRLMAPPVWSPGWLTGLSIVNLV